MRDAQPRTFFAVRLSRFQGGVKKLVKKLHTKSCISDFWYAVKKIFSRHYIACASYAKDLHREAVYLLCNLWSKTVIESERITLVLMELPYKSGDVWILYTELT